MSMVCEMRMDQLKLQVTYYSWSSSLDHSTMYMQAPHSYCASSSHDVHQQLSRWVPLMYFQTWLVMPDSSKQSATPLLVLFRIRWHKQHQPAKH